MRTGHSDFTMHNYVDGSNNGDASLLFQFLFEFSVVPSLSLSLSHTICWVCKTSPIACTIFFFYKMHSCDFYTHTYICSCSGFGSVRCDVVSSLCACVQFFFPTISYTYVVLSLVPTMLSECISLCFNLSLYLSVCVQIGGVNMPLYLFYYIHPFFTSNMKKKLQFAETERVKSIRQHRWFFPLLLLLWFLQLKNALCISSISTSIYYSHTHADTYNGHKDHANERHVQREFNDKYTHTHSRTPLICYFNGVCV